MGSNDPIVKVKQGLLRGKYEKNCKGGTFTSFKGIPYAEPPTRRLRFKAPRTPLPWNGIRDALKDGSPCKHKHVVTDERMGSEDCLYLNIFTPKLPKPKILLPVLFWIHGGGFYTGSNSVDMYGPDFLLTEDVVFVSTNYRLGALGFLGFTDPRVDAPGNNGLKDCVAALKWVQDNIEQFGGDPRNVTIFGESAGSILCHYLCLSRMARGLFHRAILQSGSALASWANSKPQPWILAKLTGYTGNMKDERAIYEYLLKVPEDTLFDAQNLVPLQEGYTGGLFPWAPIIEISGCPTEPNFITKHPLEIIKSGDVCKVPMIFGYNSGEGLMMLGEKTPKSFLSLMETTKYEYLVPWSYQSILPQGSPQATDVGNLIHKIYWGDKIPSNANFQPFVNYCSDIMFVVSITDAIKLHAKHSSAPVYLYVFDVDLPYGYVKNKLIGVNYPGCAHGEDLSYLFSSAYTQPGIIDNSDSGKTIYRFVKLWTNFAKFGDPNVHNDGLINVNWKPFTIKEEAYLKFGLQLELKQKPDFERRKFWNDLGKKYNMSIL